VEDAIRFAGDLVVQELGIALLAKRDVRLLTASGDDLTESSRQPAWDWWPVPVRYPAVPGPLFD
jgi:hypothetical protein